jgi:hypothetical protein
VNEIRVLSINPVDERVIATDIEIVPAYVWDFPADIEPDVPTGDQVQPCHLAFAIVIGFLTGGEKHLHPETNPEEWPASRSVVCERLSEWPGVFHPFTERADSRKDDAICRGERVWVVGNLDICTGSLQSTSCRPKIPESVVNKNDIGYSFFRRF